MECLLFEQPYRTKITRKSRGWRRKREHWEVVCLWTRPANDPILADEILSEDVPNKGTGIKPPADKIFIIRFVFDS